MALPKACPAEDCDPSVWNGFCGALGFARLESLDAVSAGQSSPRVACEPGALPSTTPFDLPRPPEATATGALFGPVLPPFPLPVVFAGPDSAAADLPRPPEVTVESLAAQFAATPARAKKIDVHAEREVDALWVEINVHKAARDELYVVLKSLQESIEAAKSGTALYYQLSDGSRQIRVKIRNESNALHALHARKDEISAAINGQEVAGRAAPASETRGVVSLVATGRRRRR